MKEPKTIRQLVDSLYFDEEQMEAFLDELRRNLVSVRTSRGLSVVEMSAKTGLSESYIYKYEHKGSVSISTLVKILTALGLNWTDVVPVIEEEAFTYGKRFEYITRDLDAKTINLLLENARTVAAIKGTHLSKESGE